MFLNWSECRGINLNLTFEEREREMLLQLLNRLLLSQMFYWIRPETFPEGCVIAFFLLHRLHCWILRLERQHFLKQGSLNFALIQGEIQSMIAIGLCASRSESLSWLESFSIYWAKQGNAHWISTLFDSVIIHRRSNWFIQIYERKTGCKQQALRCYRKKPHNN